MDEKEIAHERDKILTEALQQKASMVRLLGSSDWKTFAKFLQEQIDRRFLEVLSMPMGADDLIQKTYTSGELAGIKIALDYPRVLIDFAQASIDSARVLEENTNGQETKPNGNAGRGTRDLGEDWDEFNFDDSAGRGRSAP